MTNTLNINYSALNDPSRLCVVWYKFRHGNESVISWAEFLKMWKTEARRCFIHSVGVFFSLLLAVKVQKSNHHHWDQSGNYYHPPHASHSKTWSSPSHPHNQQDHCKCKLSLVTALLLARHHSRSPFFSMIVKSFFQEVYPNTGFFLLLHVPMVLLWMMNLELTVPAFWYVFPFSSGEWWLLPFLHSHLRLQQPG